MFDKDKFLQAMITQPTKALEVPQLKGFFPKDAKPVWEVSALTSEQVARVAIAEEKNAGVGKMITALLGSNKNEQVEAIRKTMGGGDDLPSDYARRIEIILEGSVDLETENDRETVLKIAIYYPSIFMTISNEILILSGEGGFIKAKP